MDLAPCPACRRHVRVVAATCPFCGVTVAVAAPASPTTRLSRAGLIAFALAAGCQKDADTVTRDPTPQPKTSAQPKVSASPTTTNAPTVTAIAAPYGAAPPPVPSLTDTSLVVTSTAGISDANFVVQDMRDRITRCADTAAKLNAKLTGTIRYELTVDPTGRVTSADVVTDTIKIPALQKCAKDVAGSGQFTGGPTPTSAKVAFDVKINSK